MSRSYIVAFLFAMLSSAFAFVARTGVVRSALSMKMDIPKVVASLTPALVASPAFASIDANSLNVSLEVTFAAYLAVLLGTLLPVTFLVTLYFQSEARKAGLRGQK